MANRNGSDAWSSDYETSWVLLAITETLAGKSELQASFDYSAILNGSILTSGTAGSSEGLATTVTTVPLSSLDPNGPNALQIDHGTGSGTLYYRADLVVDRPVESAPALSKGITLDRTYFVAGQDCTKVTCQPVDQIKTGTATQPNAITVRLTLTIPHDMYNLMVEDYIPAGTVIFNKNLNTSQLGLENQSNGLPPFDSGNPFQYGWGWWIFNNPQIYPDHVLWTAAFLQAGTYQLTYTLLPTQAGEFRVIPAHAWEAFFPEVQGTTAGTVFKITE
jgi:alpha-2-macroglobulin